VNAPQEIIALPIQLEVRI